MKIDIKGSIISDSDAWIYEWFGISCTCPRKVLTELSKNPAERAEVYINSGGGSVFAGSEIYSALRAHPGGVLIHIVGIAASAASVIACAGESDISPTGMVMVHNVSTAGAEGDYHVKDKESEVLRQANRTIAAAYVEKTGMTEADALAMMDAETWLTADDAVKRGLIDRIWQPEGAENLVAAAGCTLLPREVLDKMRAQGPQGITGTTGADPAQIKTEQARARLKLLRLINGGTFDD